MRNILYVFILLILVIACMIAFGFLWYYQVPKPQVRDTSPTPIPVINQRTLHGEVFNVSVSTQILTLKTGREEKAVVISSETNIIDYNGSRLSLSDIQKGFSVEAKGVETTQQILTASEIKVTKKPTIIILSPLENQQVERSFNLSLQTDKSISSLQIKLTNDRTNTVYINRSIQIEPTVDNFYTSVSQTISIGNVSIRNADPLTLELIGQQTKDQETRLIIPLSIKLQ